MSGVDTAIITAWDILQEGQLPQLLLHLTATTLQEIALTQQAPLALPSIEYALLAHAQGPGQQ